VHAHGDVLDRSERAVPRVIADLSPPRARPDRVGRAARLVLSPDRRIVAVTAAAGFGKSTVAAAFAEGSVTYECSPVGGRLAMVRGLFEAAGQSLPERWELRTNLELAGRLVSAPGPAVLVLEDVHRIDAAATLFVRAVGERLPPDWHLVLTSRGEFDLAPDEVLTAADLVFSEAETAAVLEEMHCPGGIAAQVYELTAGWPGPTVKIGEWLAHHPDAKPEQAHGLLVDYVRTEVVAELGVRDRRLLGYVASLPRLTPDLCNAIGLPALPRRLRPLADLGVLHRGFSVHPLVKVALDARPTVSLYQRAADYFLSSDDYRSAIESIVALDDPELTAAFVTAHIPSPLVNGPTADAVVAATGGLPDHFRTAEIERIEGRARFAQGDWPGALRYMYRAASVDGRLSPRMAWRIAAIHRFLGEHDKALAACQRAELTGAGGPDESMVLAWSAFAHVVREEPDEARNAATRALELARACGDLGALAAAHSAVGLLNGADCDQHHAAAVEAAQQMGDFAHLVCVQANFARSLIIRGMYEAGLAQLDELVANTARAGAVNGALTASLYHRGFAKLGLGRFDSAAADFRVALRSYQTSGSRATARPLLGIAEVYRERGDLELAAAAYREATQIAVEAGDRETYVLGLCGLARTRIADDPEAAAELVHRALAESEGPLQVRAHIAAGWVALARQDRPALTAAVAAAGGRVGIGIDRGGLAEVLELRAAAATDPAERLRLLRQAADCWAGAGHRVGAARVAVAVARLTGAPPPALQASTAALRHYGVKETADAAGLLAFVPMPKTGPLYIRTLGEFQVLRDGEPVPAEAWQSRKARDLVKILLTRPAAAVPRGTLLDELWPGEPPSRCANRLSVALSTVRAIFDPEHRFAAAHFVAADKFSLTLLNITSDISIFLASARDAQAAYQRGDPDAPRDLALAEALYTGDFLPEDEYRDWAAPAREQAKARYLSVVRTLARAAAETGDHDLVETYALRALERDAYDEEAHLMLIRALTAAGRHGQAQQRYRTYCERMSAIGVPAAPFTR
jgi:DNA-binding SARP family transcriptional activator/tetratricopeptide (TPR) repeat protein